MLNFYCNVIFNLLSRCIKIHIPILLKERFRFIFTIDVRSRDEVFLLSRVIYAVDVLKSYKSKLRKTALCFLSDLNPALSLTIFRTEKQ